MIDYCDFIKLFCIFNASPGVVEPSTTLSDAIIMANRLHEDGLFDDKCQVTTNDILGALTMIAEGKKQKESTSKRK